jgi:hypothetical protein
MVGPTIGGQMAAGFGIRQNFFLTGGILFLTMIFVKFFFIDLAAPSTESTGGTAPLSDEPQ